MCKKCKSGSGSEKVFVVAAIIFFGGAWRTPLKKHIVVVKAQRFGATSGMWWINSWMFSWRSWRYRLLSLDFRVIWCDCSYDLSFSVLQHPRLHQSEFLLLSHLHPDVLFILWHVISLYLVFLISSTTAVTCFCSLSATFPSLLCLPLPAGSVTVSTYNKTASFASLAYAAFCLPGCAAAFPERG